MKVGLLVVVAAAGKATPPELAAAYETVAFDAALPAERREVYAIAPTAATRTTAPANLRRDETLVIVDAPNG